MKKTSFFAVCIMITMSSMIFAGASVEKYNDWVYDFDTLVLDDEVFTFKIASSLNSVVAIHNDDTYILNIGDCEDTQLIRICLNDTYSDALYDDDRRAHIIITYYAPNLTITRSAKTSTVDAGEEIAFDAEVVNNGDFDALDFAYIDSFPKEIKIESTSASCSIGENNSVTHRGILKRGEKFRCTYRVIPKSVVDIKLKAQVDYNDGVSDQKIYSSLINIKSNAIFDVTPDFNNGTEIEVGEEFRLYINLTNIVSKELDFEEFYLRIPKEMRVVKSNMQKIGDEYFWDGALDVNESKEFFFLITPKEGGNFELEYDAKVIKDKKELLFEKNKISFEVEQGLLKIISNLDNITNYDSGKEAYFVFWLENTYNYTDALNINAAITSPLIRDTKIPISRIEKEQKKLLFKTTLLPKEVTSVTSYNFKVIVNYTTEFGTKKTSEKEWTVKLKPLYDIEIEKKLSKSTVTEGEEVTITVSVKNTRSRPIYDISIKEILPDTISRTGKTSTFINMLNASQKVTAYEYEIVPPEVKNETVIQINTTVTYYEDLSASMITESKGINYTKALDITVKPKKLDLKITKSAQSKTFYQGEHIKVKYTIENEDTETAHNLIFLFSENSDVDLLNEYTYELERLEPGEVVGFEREVIRPKKIGTYKTGTTTVLFKDLDENVFNYTINSLSIKVEKRAFGGPEIYISKILSTATAKKGEIVNATITIENKGDESIDLTVYDNEKKWYVTASVGVEKNITYKLKAGIDEYKEKKVFAFYTYHSNEYRAYASSPSLTVEELEEDNEEADAKSTDDNSSIINEELEELTLEEPGFFKKVWKAIRRFVGLD